MSQAMFNLFFSKQTMVRVAAAVLGLGLGVANAAPVGNLDSPNRTGQYDNNGGLMGGGN